MPYRSDITYMYDGSFEGFLCCVFESYYSREIPDGIFSPASVQLPLIVPKQIITDSAKAERVAGSIPAKMSVNVYDFVKKCFLSGMEQKEIMLLRFLRMGYKYGSSVLNMVSDDTVDVLLKAHKHLVNEAHLLKGFVRFSVSGGVLVSEIEPKNYVLPLLMPHFCSRFPQERFLIYDKAHRLAGVYEPHRYAVIPADGFEMPQPGKEEVQYRRLFRLFYETIEIKERHNPVCRRSHMPMRYWKNMTEFGSGEIIDETGELEMKAPKQLL